jgi:hypothetical protein
MAAACRSKKGGVVLPALLFILKLPSLQRRGGTRLLRDGGGSLLAPAALSGGVVVLFDPESAIRDPHSAIKASCHPSVVDAMFSGANFS